MTIFSNYLSAIFTPSFCGSCRIFLGLERASLCKKCESILQPIANRDIILNKYYTMPVFALSRYSYPLKDLILNKHAYSTWGAHALGRKMIEYIPLDYMDIDVCISVPLHTSRLWHRGFNQASIIAQHIAHYKNACMTEPLKRKRSTAFQSSVAFNQRANNVLGAFELKKNYDTNILFNKHILLVDDLMTTGSTLKEIAHILIAYRPASISAFVACRTP